MSRNDPIAFEDACAAVDAALSGAARREIVAEVSASRDLGKALRRLREGMRANRWKTNERRIDLERIVERYDRRTRQDGFHALHDWDGKADRLNENTIPIDVLDYVIASRGGDASDRTVVALL